MLICPICLNTLKYMGGPYIESSGKPNALLFNSSMHNVPKWSDTL